MTRNTINKRNSNTRFRLDNISKTYPPGGKNQPPVTAFENLSFSIPEREVTAITGPSGAGKSTLARLIMRMDKPDNGQIFYRNLPIQSISLKKFRKKNQMMFQSPLLSVNPYFSIKKIIREPLIVNFRHLGKKTIHEKVREWMDILGLPSSYLVKRPHELSGGELQRVVLARTMIMEPEFVILDEPFSSLDDATASRLIEYLRCLIDSHGIGMLLISHNTEHVDILADRIVRL